MVGENSLVFRYFFPEIVKREKLPTFSYIIFFIWLILEDKLT